MRCLSVLACLLILTGVSRAAGPDDQYLDIYNQILQADNLQQNGHTKEAVAMYVDAQRELTALKAAHPNWNTDVVSFRLDYLSDQLHALAKAASATPAPPPAAVTPAKPVVDVAGLQEQIRALTAANGALENKLKEALAIQPAAVSPRELAKAQEQIVALQKEKDLLTVALEQAKASQPAEANQALASQKARSAEEAKSAAGQIEQLKGSLADAQKRIAEDDVKIEALKLAQTAAASTGEITAERDKLKEELAARTKDLADSEAHRDQSVVELRAKLADMEKQRDDLQAKLAAAPVAAPVPAATDAQVDELRARLSVLEAQKVPYTPEELALLKKEPTSLPPQEPTPSSATNHLVHSKKDLPPGTGALMEEATRATAQRDYAKAAEKFAEILRQDENNVFVLEYLANAQFALGQLAECEKTVVHALALDPDDAPSLYILGVLRYRQEKLDDALNALSRSVKFASTNTPTQYSATQYYLGRVLAEKGLRAGAETAFRRALEYDPKYAEAHYSLAFVYAAEKPPSLELARWHYQRAVDLGHEKSPELEKLLTPSP
ncbi:MAG TPA: tetratricopeptide repeat protein [Verrucomicrobiae bacterium]|nr:tetratricopeptide repeat protein [Verrucomicrobiae bacterium]